MADMAPSSLDPTSLDPGDALAQMRAARPLVHQITNHVAMPMAANVLLAAGASPAMIMAREEAAEFAATASALTVNMGTPLPETADAMVEAAEAVATAGRPWVLDPVACFATGYRRALAGRLMACRPVVIRGNASEILALAGAGGSGKGVDAGDHADADRAAALARASGVVVAVTGAEDLVTDGMRSVWIAGGDPVMPSVTALGCALSGLVAAYLGAGSEPFDGTVAALTHYAVAGALAGERSRGPGSFAVAFLDALAEVSPEMLRERAKLS